MILALKTTKRPIGFGHRSCDEIKEFTIAIRICHANRYCLLWYQRILFR